MGLQTIKECRKKNKPYMIELVGCAWDSFWNHGISGKILAPYLFLRTKREVKNAPFVVYVTSEFLQRRYPTNGVNTNISNVKLHVQDSEVLKNRLRKISERNRKIVLGTAANVDIRYKGQQYVIEALGILKKQGITNFEYQILGAGDQSYLKGVAKKNNVEDQVKFLGSYPHEKVFDWLKNELDIYVQASLQEGLPRSVIEAMSVGLPCIGSDVAGIPELLDKKWVFKRKGNKAEEIADFAKEKGLSIYALNSLDSPELYTLDPAEFLYMIQNASYVLTDSFHAVAFSIKFNKEFYVFDRKQDGVSSMFSRIETITKRFGLENRIQSRDRITEQEPISNWNEIEEELVSEKIRSMGKLVEAMGI